MPPRARRRRRLIATFRGTLPLARAGILDRVPSAGAIAVAVLLSASLHAIALRAGASVRHVHRDRAPDSVAVRVAIVEKPVPEPETAKVVEADRSRPEIRHPRPRPPTVQPPEPPAPVPPPEQPVSDPGPAPTAPPLLVAGIAATTTGGTLGVRIGNTVNGDRSGTPVTAGEGKAYKASEFAPAYALTEEPIFLDNVSPEQVRRFYPEDSRRAKIEGVVRVKMIVDDDGTVARVVLTQDPGHGFGPAAVKLARLYRFKAATVNGRPVATEISFTIRFELD